MAQLEQNKQQSLPWLKGLLWAVVIGLAVNVLISLFMDKGELLDNLRNVSWYLIIIPLFTQILVVLIETLRTKIVLHGMKEKISWGKAFTNSGLGWFFNLVTPMSAGGQPFQIFHLKSKVGLSSRRATNLILSRFVVNAMLTMILIGLAVPAIIDIGRRLPASAALFYTGLTVTFCFSVFFLIVLVNPLIIGKFALRSRHSKFGAFVARLTKRPRWSLELLQWTSMFRREVVFLWSQRLGYVLIDVVLNLLQILVQGWALYYVIHSFTGVDIGFWQGLASYVIVWQTVFYIPTPGSSGSLEAVFTLVFSGLTRMPEATLVAVLAWRLGSYYLFLAFCLLVLLGYLRSQKKEQAVSSPAG